MISTRASASSINAVLILAHWQRTDALSPATIRAVDGANLSQLDLTGANLSQLQLERADLTETDLNRSRGKRVEVNGGRDVRGKRVGRGLE